MSGPRLQRRQAHTDTCRPDIQWLGRPLWHQTCTHPVPTPHPQHPGSCSLCHSLSPAWLQSMWLPPPPLPVTGSDQSSLCRNNQQQPMSPSFQPAPGSPLLTASCQRRRAEKRWEGEREGEKRGWAEKKGAEEREGARREREPGVEGLREGGRGCEGQDAHWNSRPPAAAGC
jgi:hypothetical protein